MSKKLNEEKPLTEEQAARRAAGIAASQERRRLRAAQKAAANEHADALAKWTGDKCPELLAGEIQQEFLDLNAKITAKLDIFTSKAADTKLAFDDLIPDLDIMQAMLSQRGRYRKLMNTLGLPTWTGWYKEFQKRCALEYSLKTVQRRLKEYRGELGEEPKPEPSIYEDLFNRLNALVPSWSDGVEHVLVDRLNRVTSRTAETHGDDLSYTEKVHLDYSITILEEIARDFAAYAAALKEEWTGREQWLREQEEDKQRRFSALKGETEESKSEIRAEQDETLATSSRSTSEDHAQEPSNLESDSVVYWVPPASPPKIKGWSKMRAGQKLEAARAAGCIYCTTHDSARSCPTHGWKEKCSPTSRTYVTPTSEKDGSELHKPEPEDSSMPAITAEANQPCWTP